MPKESQPLIIDYVIDAISGLITDQSAFTHLDVGAGWGDLPKALKKKFPQVQSSGCDYNPHHNQADGLEIKKANLNSLDPLSFEDEAFDLITCTEVVEHLENFRHVFREIYRVTKPGGLAVFSTPNVLSLRSRFKFLTRGLYEFFDPLPLASDERFYPGELHITPLPYFYYAHCLRDLGFGEFGFTNDKAQRFSQVLYPLMWPLLTCAVSRSLKRRRRKLRVLPDEIEEMAADQNAYAIATGRTIIFWARKPK